MKVIAVTTDKYIAEVSSREMQRLTGYDPGWSPQTKSVGLELNILQAWDTIQSLLHAKASMPATANKLRALADILEPIATEIPTEIP
jgi:hypothetical protein